MKIQSKDIPAQEAAIVAAALGKHLGLMDNQRNTRAATMAEVEEFCFAPLREITREYKRQLAIAAANITVTAFDEPAA